MAWQPGVLGGDAGRHGEAAHRYRDRGAGTRNLVEPFLARDDERGLGDQLFERLGIDGRVIGAGDADQLAGEMRGIGWGTHKGRWEEGWVGEESVSTCRYGWGWEN